MSTPRISEDLRPLSEMKSKPSEVIGHAQRTGRPVVLTRYGKGVAVVLSVESYEDLQLAAAKLRLLGALKEAERAIENGEVVSHEEMDKLLEEMASDA